MRTGMLFCRNKACIFPLTWHPYFPTSISRFQNQVCFRHVYRRVILLYRAGIIFQLTWHPYFAAFSSRLQNQACVQASLFCSTGMACIFHLIWDPDFVASISRIHAEPGMFQACVQASYFVILGWHVCSA